MQTIHDVLAGGSVRRLAKYRRNLAKSLETIRANRTPEEAEKFIHAARYTSPLNHRYGWMGDAAHGPTFRDDGDAANIPACVLSGLRDAGAAHDIVNLRHRGWYTDADFSETIAGRVWQLPARKGETQYIAGYVDGESGYVVLDATRGRITIFNDKEDAARAADSLAENDAEKQREYSERWYAASEAAADRDIAREELKAAREDAQQAVAAIRAQRKLGGIAPAMCKIMQDKITTARAEMRRALNTIAEKTATIESLGMRGEF